MTLPLALSILEQGPSDDGARWLAEQMARPATELRAALPVILPGLARRVGREGLAGQVELAGAWADLSAWRRCDAAGLRVLAAADPVPDPAIVDLFLRGDLEERTILLRSATLRPLSDATSRLLDEVQRSNIVAHLEAGALDSNLLARSLDGGLLSRDRFDRLVLKAAFNDLPLARMHGVASRPGPELSRMLQGLATEREAAGRSVWRDTCRLTAGAPVPGTVARVLGDLEHGDAGRRLAAAEALLILRRPDLAAFARERLAREDKPDVRRALERALAS